MIKVSKTLTGFSLIETLVYLALFAIFVAGAVLAAFNMIESGGRNQTGVMVQEEGNFLLEKFDWAFLDAQSISSPAANASGSTLTINNFDSSTVALSFLSGNMQIQDSEGKYVINNSSVKVSCPDLTDCFSYNSASGSGVNPQSVEFNFTLSANTPGGLPVSQTFFAVKYLQK